MFEKWSLRDVILLALLAILFGGIFVGSGFLYNILTAILAPARLEKCLQPSQRYYMAANLA